MGKEIEKKFLIRTLPDNMEQYEQKEIEQGYLCTSPIVRIRKSNEEYILTYKSKFGIASDAEDTSGAKINHEVELPLTKEGYEHLKEKTDGYLIRKTRYIIPLENGLKAELDIFKGRLEGLVFAEVEFPDEATAQNFQQPQWLGENVSFDHRYSNYYLSTVKNLAVFKNENN